MSEMKHCGTCDTTMPVAEFHRMGDGYQPMCKTCKHEANARSNPNHNPLSMYVNGKYVSRKHPLYKPGRYKTFEDAAFESLQNYSSSKEGQVYVIANDAFPGWVKIGMAVSAEDRLNGYQTSDPYRGYRLIAAFNTEDRRASESVAHEVFGRLYERRNEWFAVNPNVARDLLECIV